MAGPKAAIRGESMSGNHEGELMKKCPFLNSWCIEKTCALFIQVAQTQVNSLGIMQAVQHGMCSLPALCMIMSSPKPQQQEPQVINLPLLFKK